MKKILITVILLLSFSLGTYSQSAQNPATDTTSTQDVVVSEAGDLEQNIALLQKEWARIKYQLPEKSQQQRDAISALADKAETVSSEYPDRAEPKIWQGIIVATDAGVGKWFSAMGKVKQAKALFETAIKIDPEALAGAAYTSLGSLYYQLPGWPVGFGDSKKAEEYLQKGLKVDPGGIDSNCFYGDFLLEKKLYAEARTYLEQALRAPDRPLRPVADSGRRDEINAALAQIKKNDNNRD